MKPLSVILQESIEVSERIKVDNIKRNELKPDSITTAVKANKMVSEYWKQKVYSKDVNEQEFYTLLDLYDVEPHAEDALNDLNIDLNHLCNKEIKNNIPALVELNFHTGLKNVINEVLDIMEVDIWFLALWCIGCEKGWTPN